MSGFDYDVLVIGSGFGGSVTALRLTEKGYKVGVLEAGARFADADFADNSWDLKKYLYAPSAGCYGIQRIDMVKDCLILAGAGSVAARWSTPTPSTSRSRRSTRTPPGPTSPTGGPSSRPTTTRPSGCWAWSPTRG